MQNKYKWMIAEASTSIKSISAAIKENPFNKSSLSGFYLEDKPSNFKIRAKFIKKVVEREIIEDPFGSITEQVIESYEIITFTIEQIKKGFFIICLINPSRGVAGLINNLCSALNSPIYISNIDIDPTLTLRAISTQYNTKIVRKIVSSVAINNKTVGKFELTATEENHLDDKALLKSYPHKVESLKAKLFLKSVLSTIMITRNGSATIIGDGKEEIINNIEKFYSSCGIRSLTAK
ncbi:hypothetical protein [Dyella mobilis]|uniref:Uncharacterized protein n=1 Tax=Dyella mobilis TaxID=1849582 RepID=A0ABS2KL38_9GAMM|nr:hypothetical protein [Dyella mobilis]MBM7131874.1 hypothetical protein [Dyella mobilis]GLQ96144.1 hypothetical protein GCM10007863_05620 [Dyella mobilis]